VLVYTIPITNGMVANLVLGQPDFTSNLPNNGGTSANSLAGPVGVEIDGQGNLYVADGNHRVLEYDAPLTTDATADRVFGQPNFTSGTFNNGGVSASSLYLPSGIIMDTAGNLFVADTGNHRVLEYDSPLSDPPLTITGLNPSAAIASSAPLTLTIDGTGFDAGAIVRWNGVARPTTLISSIQLTAQIDAADIAAAGVISVTVSNPPYDNTSNTLSFTINNPAPVLNALSHTSAIAGSAGFTLTVTGTNFVDGSVVRWSDTNRPTTFVSSTQLMAQIGAPDIATAGVVSIRISNPMPGGGTSSPYIFTINNPLPTIAGLSRSEALAGSAGFTLTVTSTNFVGASVVQWNGAARPTTFVSSTQPTAEISAADLETAGSATVTVFNPAPGGGVSNTRTFTIKPQHIVYLPLVVR
jgi:hypothetical protein